MLETHGNKVYLYTAADERVYVLDWQGSFEASTESWTLRGAGTQVLRELTSRGNTAGLWSWGKDYVYRGAQLLASVAPAGVRHYTLDHLGTPRLVTDANATRVGYHAYYPFGQEATNPAQNDETMKFTGHEKDANGPGTADDLDYMQARYAMPGSGRFLSVDPKERRGALKMVQRWNRYSYAVGNPLNFVDPDGLDIQLANEGDSAGVRNALVEVIRRPTGRERVVNIANDRNFTARFTDARINKPEAIAAAVDRQPGAQVTGGDTNPAVVKVDGVPNHQATVRLDMVAIRQVHPDKTGTTTMAHKLLHTDSARQGMSSEGLRNQDLPGFSGRYSEAETFGMSVAAEEPDITKDEASALLDILLFQSSQGPR